MGYKFAAKFVLDCLFFHLFDSVCVVISWNRNLILFTLQFLINLAQFRLILLVSNRIETKPVFCTFCLLPILLLGGTRAIGEFNPLFWSALAPYFDPLE